jgi:hypothetical protein
MFSAILALTAATAQPLPAPKDGEIYAAIWNDLFSGAWIGNGNGIGWLWYWGGHGGDDPRTPTAPSHIDNLACKPMRTRYRCSFILRREGGPVTITAFTAPPTMIAPDILSCRALFYPDAQDGGWSIDHDPPPPRGGHSRTTMRCYKRNRV